MIYVSSSCVKATTIKESVLTLADAGFRNIELSGGTKYYPDYERDLLMLQDKFSINYLIHNYFPPPVKPFVLNLASLNNKIFKESIDLCVRAIKLSKKLGCNRYAVHAGFLIDVKTDEIGKRVGLSRQFDKVKALKRFSDAWKILREEAKSDVSLYIENNVLSSTNAITFSGNNPFLLTDNNGYLELKEQIDFNLLLDLAHLKVSANSLAIDYEVEMKNLLPHTDYIHISENDGLHDKNMRIDGSSKLIIELKKYNMKNRVITLEVYDGIDNIMESYKLVYKELKQ